VVLFFFLGRLGVLFFIFLGWAIASTLAYLLTFPLQLKPPQTGHEPIFPTPPPAYHTN